MWGGSLPKGGYNPMCGDPPPSLKEAPKRRPPSVKIGGLPPNRGPENKTPTPFFEEAKKRV